MYKSKEIKDEEVIAEDVIVEETEEVVAEDVTSSDDAAIEAPLTASRTISAITASLQEMSKEDLDAIFEAAKKAEAKVDVDSDEEDEEGDEEDGEVAEKDFKEDVDALVNGEDSLSEGFKDKAATIFEAALQAKVATKTAELEERYASDLSDEVEAIKEDLVDKVDGYLNYVVENWMKENEVAIENSLKSEITESFITSLGAVFKEHHINVPEDKGDLIDQLSEEAKDAKDQLNAAQDANMELSEKVKSFERKEIVAEACEGLAATEAAKVAELTEGLEASDNEEFASKVATIKESYLNKNDTEVKADDEVDAITEEKETSTVEGPMAKYLDALKKTK